MSEDVQYSVGYEPTVQKELGKLDRQITRRILRAVSALSGNPRPAGCRRLVGYDDLWRIRDGDYRVVYTIKDTELIVLALRIAARCTDESDESGCATHRSATDARGGI